MSSTVDDTYVVKLPNGDARVMTVEELDAALDAGLIHSSTQLLPPGSATWTTLGVLAGLDDVAPPAPPLVPMSPSSLVPVAFPAPSDIALADVDDELGVAGRRRAVKIVGIVFGAAAVIAIVFGIQSAISQSIASSATQAALAAQPPAPPPAPIPPPPVLPPVIAKAPPPPTPQAAPAAPASAKASAKSADKKNGKLPSAPKKKK